MSLPACLVTSSPTFEEPERTPPFLIGPTARPDLRQVKVVDVGGIPDPVEFSAQVRSEDNGQQVFGRLVLDYGIAPQGGPGYPYQQILKDVVTLEPGTLEDKARILAAKWYPGSNKAPVGCHTVTLFATHEINFETGCPADPDDFDHLTWTVYVCDSTSAPCCDPELPAEQGGCTNFQCPPIDEDVRCDVPSVSGGAP